MDDSGRHKTSPRTLMEGNDYDDGTSRKMSFEAMPDKNSMKNSNRLSRISMAMNRAQLSSSDSVSDT